MNTSDLALHDGIVTGDSSDKVLTGRKYVVIRFEPSYLFHVSRSNCSPYRGIADLEVIVLIILCISYFC